jgi:hypothetical protein
MNPEPTHDELAKQVAELTHMNESLARLLSDAEDENAELTERIDALEDDNASAEQTIRFLENAAALACNARITHVEMSGAWMRLSVELDTPGVQLELRDGAPVRIMAER